MFYNIIQRKRNEWLSREDCPVKSLLSYIDSKGMMRDAQIEAIKTYLFLKIECNNKPLWRLFAEGSFLSLDLDDISLTAKARSILETNQAAATLYEYACLKDDKGNIVAPVLKQYIEEHPEEIAYVEVFKKLFYSVAYPDYIFSLPMGAGKTYLMAAFIYLDLYFSLNEPDNPVFAHNFMVLAPSGLKSSIIPSIKNIQDFDPTWILPEPAASQIRNEIQFEILDEQKTAQKSNLVKNPNAQKINNHQPFEYLRGLVAVTNAEKVILNKIDKDRGDDRSLYTDKEWEDIKNSNELRNIIAKIPRLSIFIDEVHHASDGDIKLRQVVNKWTETETFNSVLGFSGTPYLSSAEAVDISSDLSLQNKNLSNVVYYYPLIEGVGNFLKSPLIKISNGDYEAIVRKGVSEFLDTYGSLVYANGTCAKLAIYCSRIDTLEENIYPIVAELISKYGLNPTDTILKYHGGNKEYTISADAAIQFASLDTHLSKIKVVLLAQIGKEGWDCKSLTSVILPQKGACPQNMVLQTSCRCLRQVVRKEQETALIWLNEENAKTLNKELDKQQHTSIEELNKGANTELHSLQRFSRMEKLRVPPIDFYQLKVSYQTLILENELNTSKELKSKKLLVESSSMLISQQDLKGKIVNKTSELLQNEEQNEPITFNAWVHLITKESFGTLTTQQLKTYNSQLKTIFDSITEEREGIIRYPKGEYSHRAIRANIRKAFIPTRSIDVKEEIIPETATLLKIEKLVSPIEAANASNYYPVQEEVLKIVDADKGIKKLKDAINTTIDTLKALGNQESTIQNLLDDPNSYEALEEAIDNKTYHYLPYKFDSKFEIDYFSSSLQAIIKDKQLEVYFNGDDELTDFKIRCYKQNGISWNYIGKYVPDFLLLSRDEQDAIKQIIIIETKGEGFAGKFAERRSFMGEFVKRNNEKFGYDKFSFLYIEDTLTKTEQDYQTIQAINQFFK
ncbi:MAG: DEAD/DEAH box helicase family protein [Bacteroidaceae bacterium]